MQKLLKGMWLLRRFIIIIISFIVINPATTFAPLITHPLYQYLPPGFSHYLCVSFHLVILALFLQKMILFTNSGIKKAGCMLGM